MSTQLEDPRSPSMLTKFLERTEQLIITICPKGIHGSSDCRCAATVGASANDEVKLKIATKIKCYQCEKICLAPVYSCRSGHVICKSCIDARNTGFRGEKNNFCKKCNSLQRHEEIAHLTNFLTLVKVRCYCGVIILGNMAIRQHGDCCKTKERLEREKLFPVKCEFCNASFPRNNIRLHILSNHFGFIENNIIGRFETNAYNWANFLFPIPNPLFDETVLSLPLKNDSGAAWLFETVCVATIADNKFGVFKLHQVKVLHEEYVWIVSFTKAEVNHNNESYSAEDFVAELLFEAVSKDTVYKRTIDTLVYPLATNMEENEFLSYVGLVLRDNMVAKFPYAYKMDTKVKVRIRRSGFRIRRACRLHVKKLKTRIPENQG